MPTTQRTVSISTGLFASYAILSGVPITSLALLLFLIALARLGVGWALGIALLVLAASLLLAAITVVLLIVGGGPAASITTARTIIAGPVIGNLFVALWRLRTKRSRRPVSGNLEH